MSAAFSAIAMTAAFVLPRTIEGMTDAFSVKPPSEFQVELLRAMDISNREDGDLDLPIDFSNARNTGVLAIDFLR